MPPTIPARAQAGLYATLALALVSTLAFLLDAISFDRKNDPESSGAAGYIKRYEVLRRELPTTNRLGYLTNMEKDPGDAEFHLTQYALAPMVLEQSTKPRYIIGNMVKAPDVAYMDAHGVVALKDYGAGVVLFERKQKP
jgi:hypothetical protein